jgi:hypothetical protein
LDGIPGTLNIWLNRLRQKQEPEKKQTSALLKSISKIIVEKPKSSED